MDKSSGQIEADHKLDEAMMEWIAAYGLVPAQDGTALEYLKAYNTMCHAIMKGVLDTVDDDGEA